MEKKDIINLVMVAVVTMVTTAVVTRLSLNKGQLWGTSKLKERFTPKFRAYTKLIFSLVWLIYTPVIIYLFINQQPQEPITRTEAFWLITVIISVLVWLIFSIYSLVNLVFLYAQEREQREKALLRKFEDEQAARLQPTIDKLKETLRISEEGSEERKRIREGRVKDSPDKPETPII